MLTIKSLIHRYGKNVEIDYRDWHIDKGRHAMILGDSGSGKTTLLHLIGGLLRPSRGLIYIDGEVLSNMTSSALDQYRGQNIGIVFQKPHLVSALSALENLKLAQYLRKTSIDATYALEIMDRLGIADLQKRKIHQLSQGQAQRVSIARAVLNKPKLLLADEPTAGLDDKNCKKVLEMLKSQAQINDSTLIVATHDLRVKNEFKETLEL